MTIKIRRRLEYLLLLMCLFCLKSQNTYAAEDFITDAKNGIVAVQSGFVDAKGEFHQMKFGSGLLISNADGSAYIVTSYLVAENTREEINHYCKEHKIKRDNSQFTNTARIVVKDDVTVNAEILVKSEEEKYCILSTTNVISEKDALKIGDVSTLQNGTVLYALGFPKARDFMEFSISDVEIFEGKVENIEKEEGKISKIKTTIEIHEGSVGGPVIDQNGYVVGVNIGLQDIISISDIAEVLDNFSIYYGSRGIDTHTKQLKALYDECVDIRENGRFKKESINNLETALEAVKPAMENERPTDEMLQEAIDCLLDAKQQLVAKMSKIMIAIYVLLGVIIFLLLWIVILLIMNIKDKRRRRIVRSPIHSVTMNDESIPNTYNVKRNSMALELLCVRNHQQLNIKMGSFYIGSKPEIVDYCIRDNKKISRQHAMIGCDGSNFYISDLKSSNGTRVNNRVIQAGQKVAIHSGDEIMLADEKFMVL